MKKLYPLYGIVTVLNTPFREDDTIDYLALERNVSEAMKAGVAGFLVPAMASEVQKLTAKEKLSMVDCALQAVSGKVPIFAGSASGSIEDSKKAISSYLNLGCTNVLTQLPYESDEQFKNNFYKLADLGPEVIMLQDWGANGYGLGDELIMELFEEVPAFRCLKVETVPAGVKYSNILRLSQGRMNVSGGWAVSQLPEALDRGIHAFMPTGMHWIYTRIYNEYQKGNVESAMNLFHELLPVLAFSNQHLDISIHFFKRLLWKQGIYPTANVRAPILPFDAVHQKIADRLIQRVIELEERIKSNNC